MMFCETQEVTALEFHPYIQMLISGGRDCTLKFFEFSKSSVKKAYRSITVRIYLFILIEVKAPSLAKSIVRLIPNIVCLRF